MTLQQPTTMQNEPTMSDFHQDSQLRYGELLSYLSRHAHSPHRAEAFGTALRGWLEFAEKNLFDPVGPEFAVGNDDVLQRYRLYCLREGSLAESTIVKRLATLRQLARTAELLAAGQTLPSSLSAALRVLHSRSGLAVSAVALMLELPKATLYAWSNGARPRIDQRSALVKLEKFFEIPADSLVSRANFLLPSESEAGPRTAFAARMSQIVLDRQRDGGIWLPFHLIADEWRDYLDYKCDDTRPEVIDAANKCRPPLWRAKPRHETGMRLHPQLLLRNGWVCASAGVAYGHIATYLGWRHRVSQLSMPESAHLAWLVDATSIRQHAEWKAQRSGGTWSSGIRDFLAQVMTMTRTGSGYLWQRPEFARNLVNPAKVLGFKPESLSATELTTAWQAACERCWEATKKLQRAKFPAGKPVRPSRAPQEGMRILIEDETPLQKLLEQLQRYALNVSLERMGQRRITAERDVLLLFMLAANPLRINQYAIMQYQPNNTGNLYRDLNGAWRVRFRASDFKNTAGAAWEDYDVPVPESLWHRIDYYLAEIRPRLVGANTCSHVFLPTKRVGLEHGPDLRPGWTTSGIESALKRTALRAFPGITGFGPHSMRHLRATDHFRHHPGDIEGAARLLNDTYECVRKTYFSQDKAPVFRRINQEFDRAMQRASTSA